MANKTKQIKPTTKIKIFINCGSKCGFPECKEHLVEEGSIIGEIAHIKAQQSGGPRFDSALTEDERNAPENLIALCKKHHKIIDDHPVKYPVEDISGWKKDIEAWAKDAPQNTELSKILFLIMLTDLLKELDKGNGEYVLKTIQSLKVLSENVKSDKVNFELEILEAQTMQSLEKVGEAKGIYKSLSKRYIKNVEPLLYLAEIYLNEGDYKKNKELLSQAENVNKEHWLLIIEKLIRKLRINQNIDISNVEEGKFPEDKRIKSIYYRIYSHFYQKNKNYIKADEFIEKAIKVYPYSFSSFQARLSFYLERLVEKGFPMKNIEEADRALNKIKEIEENKNWDKLNIGNRVVLEFRKLYIHMARQDYKEIALTGKKMTDLILLSSFDLDVDNFLSTDYSCIY